MFDSKKFWNNRYKKGGNSGEGSYNQLAQFKADIINNFIEKNEIKSMVDYGVGDGNQLKLINTEKLIYTGIDVSEFIISKCKEEFKDDKTKTFIHADNIDNELKAELVLSCDVIYHLIEEHVYKEYMDNLFSMSNRYVIIYAKNEDINHAIHVKFRKFSNYIESNLPEWQLIKHIPNKFQQLKIGQNNDKTSPSDFYIYKASKIELLLTGCGCSGTKYISELLKKNGIDVGHDFDPIGKMGFVSNAIVNNEVWIYDRKKYPSEALKEKILLSKFSNIIHIVRHPLLVIPSLITKWKKRNKIWLHIKKGALDSEKDKNINILNAMKYWLYHNRHIAKYTKKIIKLEDVLQNSNTLDKYLNKSIKNKVNEKINASGTKNNLDWNSLFEVDNHITNEIIKLCNIYGYETPIMIPVYISLTSIFQNQDILLQTLQSIMKQTRLPDKIFLYLSEEAYILDTGFKDKKITNSKLLKYINDNSIIDIKWVKNIGSYRKLLPLLKDKWDEDCIIITIDDDTVYDTHLIENLVNDYHKHKCVIGYSGFTPSFDKLENFDYLKRVKLQHLSLYNFFTGKGGILYKPEFFHKTHDLIFNDKIYLDTCPTGDDIWFYIVRLLNNVKGYLVNKEWLVNDLTREKGLYSIFNMHNNNNTSSFKNTFEKLKDLEYKIS